MLLNDSRYKGDITLGGILDDLQVLDFGGDPYKKEFAELVRKLA